MGLVLSIAFDGNGNKSAVIMSHRKVVDIIHANSDYTFDDMLDVIDEAYEGLDKFKGIIYDPFAYGRAIRDALDGSTISINSIEIKHSDILGMKKMIALSRDSLEALIQANISLCEWRRLSIELDLTETELNNLVATSYHNGRIDIGKCHCHIYDTRIMALVQYLSYYKLI